VFKHILVTGGAGFIGSHLVDLLLTRGYRVRVLDNLEPQVHGESGRVPDYLSREAEFIRGDVRDRAALEAALVGVDAVVHDAAMVGVGQSQYQVHRYIDTNVMGTATLLDILATGKTKVERLLVASSMSIYGEGLYRRPSDGAMCTPTLRPDSQLDAHDFEMRDPQTGEMLEAVPTPESKPLACTSVYAQSKKDQEEYSLIVARAYGIPTVAARFFNVYGPRQSLSNPYTGAAAIFSSRIKNGNAPLIYEDGKQARDFIDVRDLVRAKLHLLESPAVKIGAVNIGTGRPTSILELAKQLCILYGRPDLEPSIVHRFRNGDIRHCYGDTSQLTELGFTPEISLEQGLRELVAWGEREQAVDLTDAAQRELESRGLVSK
jgi:dTDP-L-rhamnose 4-epimerase